MESIKKMKRRRERCIFGILLNDMPKMVYRSTKDGLFQCRIFEYRGRLMCTDYAYWII